jgi:S1-C subfamily serine protease
VRANLVAVPVSPFGVRPEQARDAGVALSYVAPGSVAQRAGLRAGDRLLRVGNDAVSSAADASRLLGQASQAKDGTPVLVAFERDGVEHGVLLPASTASERATP